MLSGFLPRRWCFRLSQQHNRVHYARSLTTDVRQQDEPLRILFCGSEAFSITALEALHAYSKSPESNILSIDVAARKDKPSGRGLKELRPPPIKRAAAQLKLPLHQFDTFTGWHLPEYSQSPQPYINLVVAVSFGLLVPPRILTNAKFGGLNVHPSMLPMLRGAAPINWAIIRGYSHTGVTIQTLHPSKFDHGIILAQTPTPGIPIPDPNGITAHELRLCLAPIAAEMLVRAIHKKLYLEPHQEIKPTNSASHGQLHLAPKITPSMKQLNPYQDNATTILRKNRGIPKLWAEIILDSRTGQQKKRLIMGVSMKAAHGDDLPMVEVSQLVKKIPIGLPFAVIATGEDVHQSQSSIFLKVKNEEIIKIPTLLVGGGREGPAAATAAHAKLFKEPISTHSYDIYHFQQHLDPVKTDV